MSSFGEIVNDVSLLMMLNQYMPLHVTQRTEYQPAGSALIFHCAFF